MDSDKNMCSQGNLKRKAVTGRACELLRLLHGTSCFEVMLNRRMPNGTYWWCERGDLISPTRLLFNISTIIHFYYISLNYFVYFMY